MLIRAKTDRNNILEFRKTEFRKQDRREASYDFLRINVYVPPLLCEIVYLYIIYVYKKKKNECVSATKRADKSPFSVTGQCE